MAKVKCEDCFKVEDKDKAKEAGWRHYTDIKISGETIKQDNWLCPDCIPHNSVGVKSV